MATVKKNNKKKIVVPICLVLVVAIILVAISAKNYAAYGQFRLKTDGEEVTLSTISTQNIIESVNATGDVTAGITKEYKVPAVATVTNSQHLTPTTSILKFSHSIQIITSQRLLTNRQLHHRLLQRKNFLL